MNFNKRIEELVPYKVSKRIENITNEDWLILDWNESTIPICEELKSTLIQYIQNGRLNLYGDVDTTQLRQSLSIYTKMKENQISVFNGSDSALNIVLESIISESDNCYILEPEYSQIKTFISSKGAIIKTIECNNIFDPNFSLIEDVLFDAKVFYFSNPNNPTGQIYDRNSIESLIKKFPNVWFLIDEAYIEFYNYDNLLKLINLYNNVIIFRTFSKAFGLAGLRIGYIVSQESNIEQINKIRNGKEVNSIAQIAANWSLKNLDKLYKNVDQTIESKNNFLDQLSSISDLKCFPSHANFVLIQTPFSKELYKHLYNDKILVRDRSDMYGLENCLRITIGNNIQMKRVLKSFKSYFKII
jgi:histidinol-phosphate aminotransferase